MSEMEKSRRPWESEQGVIDAKMLGKYLPNVVSPIYDITGPPVMVKAIHTMLSDKGVDDDNIRIEELAGY